MISYRETVRIKKYRAYIDQNRMMRRTLEKIQSDRRSVMEDVSMCVLAPCISSFVLWVLKDAVERGIQWVPGMGILCIGRPRSYVKKRGFL